MTPILKWAGGKTQLLPELSRRMPKDWNQGTYHEPFFGGGALFFALEPARARISDLNLDLVTVYQQVKHDPKKVERCLRSFSRQHGRAFYRSMRKEWNRREATDDHRRAAMFIYLNKTCFNGLWRVNRSGEFNVPIGDYKNPKICDPAILQSASRVLESTTIQQNSFFGSSMFIEPGDFVYYDPPYDPVSPTSSFTRYTSDFGREHQTELADLATDLVSRSVRVMLSNSNTKFIRKLYRDRGFKLHRVQARRSINADSTKRSAVSELIITGGY